MKLIIRLLLLPFRLAIVLAAALAGNWAGDQARARATGKPGHQWRFVYNGGQGETQIAINPVLTNFVPALLLGLALRPGWLWAFLGGAAISGLVGDRFEHLVNDRLARRGS